MGGAEAEPNRTISGNVPLNLSLSSMSSNESIDIESYSWKIEVDGEVIFTSTTSNLQHTFYEEGEYTVTLNAYGTNHRLINEDIIMVSVASSAQKVLIRVDEQGKTHMIQSGDNVEDPMVENNSSDMSTMSDETEVVPLVEVEVESTIDSSDADEFFRRARQYLAYKHIDQAKQYFIKARIAYESALIDADPEEKSSKITRIKRNLNYIYKMQQRLG
jgi:PKD repeat protein